MAEELEDRLLSHDKQLVRIETILERVAHNQDNMSDSMTSLTTAMTSLARLEGNTKESFNRMHKRLDEAIQQRKEDMKPIEDDIKALKSDIKDLRFYRFVADNWKSIVPIIIFVFSLTISDIRHKIIGNFSKTKVERTK